MNTNIFLGNGRLNFNHAEVEGQFVTIQGEEYYKISHYNNMDDFFMSIVSDSDHWLFISSNGALTAGRKNRDNALFPYYTDDKIQDYQGVTGSKTILLVTDENKRFLWEPFSKEFVDIYQVERNIYKSEFGDKIIFEETNYDLNLAFQYSWNTSDKFGFVKQARLINTGSLVRKISLLDGICNILPSGIEAAFQNEYSNLVDGYKKSELIKDSTLALFALSSLPVDKAEPSESLNVVSVWSDGLTEPGILLSTNQLNNFKRGHEVFTESDVKATRGAYLLHTELTLSSETAKDWMIVSEVNQSTTDVANLRQQLKLETDLVDQVKRDITAGTDKLVSIIAAADGLQASNEELTVARHYSNTMFNVMRGGIYLDGYQVNIDDFITFLKQRNKKISLQQISQVESLPSVISQQDLLSHLYELKNPDLIRMGYEFLPLTFSRRHGDPSRPWNLFCIETKDADGNPKSDYAGNWRDIFQNWEALSLSYPGYIESIISKFVNASTADGYNPYRIMSTGIDWESPDDDDPWVYIGYWGDHQIIYLQKLLELSHQYNPGKLEQLLGESIFVYANVPYRIKPYEELVKNPKDTVVFDSALNKQIQFNANEFGSDAKLCADKNDSIYYVNLNEKILVTLLSKLSNFIPEAGIWLNTQRPEWNDANNALVGNGTSMVTLYYLRRFLKFWEAKYESLTETSFDISDHVKQLLVKVHTCLEDNRQCLSSGFTDQTRNVVASSLGRAGSEYRDAIYTTEFSKISETVSGEELLTFVRLALEYIEQSIDANCRSDGLYHAYNLISFDENSISIRHLYEMLEGQVAVLSAGSLNSKQALEVLDALKSSKMFREDQYSYMLYPDRQLARFDKKNNVNEEAVQSSSLLNDLIAGNETSIIQKDVTGAYHFNGDIRNEDVLRDRLNNLPEAYQKSLTPNETAIILDIYEQVFDHQSFTGRSGTFYAYEGLGCIYWHMVSKLLLAVEECYFKAVDNGEDASVIGRLKDHYFEIKAGIGLFKNPKVYGSFPTDAYSHTPGHAGVKQPGMTGQVKEDVISRMGELGVRIDGGIIHFQPTLLNPDEFLTEAKDFDYIDMDGNRKCLKLNKNQLAFTVCQVPVIYTRGMGEDKVIVHYKDGETVERTGLELSKRISRILFERLDSIDHIRVCFL